MKCGFAKVDITPKVGCHLAGHPQVRPAEAIADPLYIRALSFEEGEGSKSQGVEWRQNRH